MYCSQMRTTMVVRLHPGQSKRLSAFLDSKVICNLNPTIFSLMHNKILEFLLCILDQTPNISSKQDGVGLDTLLVIGKTLIALEKSLSSLTFARRN